MSDAAKTLTFAVSALVLGAAAFFSQPGISEPEIYNDEGEEFFADFKDPTAATALEVVEFVAADAAISPFRVEFKNGRWSIPSHYHYPADAKDPMAEAAALLVGLRKESVRSDDARDHKLLGVLNPKEESLDTEGRGILVQFEDAGGNALAALIIGKEVEGRTGYRYVRVPDKKRVYTAKLEKVPSTRFENWIKTELLDAPSYDLEKLIFDNYSIDELSGSVVPGERIVARKDNYDWVVEGLTDQEETNKDTLREAANTLGSLKIVGVRPKPEGLTADLATQQGIELNAQNAMSLQSRGFFMSRDGNLYSNEGDMLAASKKGVLYTLRFGEILFGEGESLTAGTAVDDPAAPQQPAGEAGEAGDGETGEGGKITDETQSGASRYLMVTARFDETLLKKPQEEALAAEVLEKRKQARDLVQKVVDAVRVHQEKSSALPASLAQLTEGEDPPLSSLEKDPWGNDLTFQVNGEDSIVASLGADGQPGGEGEAHDVSSDSFAYEDGLQAVAKEWEDYRKKIEEGQAAAKKLSERFAPWYYVISNDSFQKLHLGRAQVVKLKAAEDPSSASTEDGTNPGDDFANLPGVPAGTDQDHSDDGDHGSDGG